MYDVRLSRFRATIAYWKSINITYSVCVFVVYIIFYITLSMALLKKVIGHKCLF
jgi:hypothetical protein